MEKARICAWHCSVMHAGRPHEMLHQALIPTRLIGERPSLSNYAQKDRDVFHSMPEGPGCEHAWTNTRLCMRSSKRRAVASLSETAPMPLIVKSTSPTVHACGRSVAIQEPAQTLGLEHRKEGRCGQCFGGSSLRYSILEARLPAALCEMTLSATREDFEPSGLMYVSNWSLIGMQTTRFAAKG